MIMKAAVFTSASLQKLFSFPVKRKVENGIVQYNTLIWLLSTAMFLGRMEILPLMYAIRGMVTMPFESIAKRRQKKKIMKNIQEE